MWFGEPQLYGLGVAISLQVFVVLLMKNAGLSIRAAMTGKQGGQPGQAPKGGTRGPKWIVKWIALFLQLLAGGGYSVAFLIMITGIVGWLNANTAGWLGVVLTIAILGVGWWALDGIVAMGKDLLDGEPDQEAFRSALLIPTTIPLGFGALWQMLTNPQSMTALSLGALVISVLAGFFMHRIINKIAGVSTGARLWRYATVVACLLVGVAHIPAAIIVNDWIGLLPDIQVAGRIDIPLPLALRMAIIGAAFAIIGGAVGDNIRGDKLPGWPTWWATMYSVPAIMTLGVMFLTGFNASAEAVFSAFS